MQLTTPKDKLNILILTFFVYVTAPFVEAFSLYNSLMNGEFPADADSIAIPIFGFFVVWVLFTPIIWIFIFWACWKYPAKASLFGFNRERPVWSFVWSSIFAFQFFIEIFTAFHNLFYQYFIESAQDFLIAYLALVFRSAIVFRK